MKVPCATFAALTVLPAETAALSAACGGRTIEAPSIQSTEVLSISAIELTNYSAPVPSRNVGEPADVTGLDACNITVQYTHPGWNDKINVQIWLPLEGWSGRFMGIGGGGWTTGNFDRLALPVSQGYAAASTDGGHLPKDGTDLSPWAQTSPGNINWYLLQDFASVALNEVGLFGKAVTESFYGSSATYSYWNGCSTGGRQGLMLAQRYPDTFDGILAASPAINWDKFIVAEYWPQLVMNMLGQYPSTCELDAITAAAVEACDGLDGVEDGLVSHRYGCDFDPFSIVGTDATCTDGNELQISAAGAEVANKSWWGAQSPDSTQMWYGVHHSANLSGLAGTTCNDSTCTGTPFQHSANWIKWFVTKNGSLDMSDLSWAEYTDLFRRSTNEFNSVMRTSDPDLSQFRKSGGKMITWHGLEDPVIFINGTSEYYERVQGLDPAVGDYYRYYEAPGVGHCRGGTGAAPDEAIDALVRWVEQSEAPETLRAKSAPSSTGPERSLNLCQYPLVNVYLGEGKDPNDAASYECRASF